MYVSGLSIHSSAIKCEIGLSKLALLLSMSFSAMPLAMAQLGPVYVTTNQSVLLPEGESIVAPNGSAIFVSGSGSVSGKDLSIRSSGRNEKTISVSDLGSRIDLFGTTTIESDGIGVYAGNGGQVSLGQGTRISVDADIGNKAAGIYIDRTAISDGAFGSDIAIRVDRPSAGVDSYARMGLVSLGAGANASFDRLSIEGNAVNVGGFLSNGSALTLTNSRVYVAGASPADGLIYWPVNVYYVDVRNSGFTLWYRNVLNLTNTDIIMDSPAYAGIILNERSYLNMVGGKIVLTAATNDSYGIRGYMEGEINLRDVQIEMFGNRDKGILSHYSQTLNADGLSISSYGADSVGVRIAKSTNGWLNNSTIAGYGDAFTGASVEINSKLVGNGLTVSATGNESTGLSIVEGGQATLKNSAIGVTGSQTTGVNVVRGTMTAEGLRLTANGERSSALKSGGNVSISNGLLAAAGDESNAVLLSGSGQLALTDSAVEGSGDAVFRIQGTNTLTLDHSSAVAKNDALLLSVADTSTVALTADNGSQLYGNAYAEGNGNVSLTLNGASAWQGSAQNIGAVSLNDSSLWNITSHTDVDALTLNNSTLAFAAPSSSDFKTLTVRGNYDAQNATVSLNTRLGGDDSPTDKLVVQGNTQGETQLHVANVGGQGARTNEGMQVVQVLGNSDGIFTLNGRLVAGLYDYDLYQGGVGANAGNGNWYLRSLATPRPETGVYLRNMSAASTMFMHTLHDRLGEPQFTDAYKTDGSSPSVWVRVVANRTDSSAANGQIDLSTDSTLVHLGGDIARWSSNGSDRWHLGVMGAYGQSDTDADAGRTPSGYKRTANGKVDGYSIGAYATWYGNQNRPTGPYVDLWGQYAWFDNSVQGNTLKEESYDSSGWTLSVEGGYAFALGGTNNRQWLIEPQAQLAYNSYSADDHREANGTWVKNGDSDGVIARLGARVYSHSPLNDNGIQPFIETNWWYNSAKYDPSFNGQMFSNDAPDNTFELKAGLQGEIAKGWQVWGHVGGRWGENSYSSYEGMLGVKHQF